MGEVVNFFSRAREKASQACNLSVDAVTEPEVSSASPESSLTFEQIASRNADLQSRIRRERAQANANVLKSYRIK
jgi:hypothetical protein